MWPSRLVAPVGPGAAVLAAALLLEASALMFARRAHWAYAAQQPL